ncbi:uncharacterized protein UMAG_10753 [Mycosarcoma maydis]|uniref:Stress-response A/B barrel domain-containing protein n=1 Tax=Mycosarcoma maydis TaxID=5270 RepID=A0A0D1DRG1_MYCMD|nr:uncharacterized protein UMAG_10753 [Ustilago maydis 521]KIS66491.1 hypothetical protein UMAG_10753 [Ustilago maydis 521]|eukprot:XP_011391934.1 hypothetical protein UMAG_10753 [Ustilago maydis 521]
MPVVHIVLVKVKQSVLSNGFDELKQKCETLKDLPIAKSKATEIKWGPPEYPGRNEGYNWGLYSVFASREDYEAYRDDEEHRNFSRTVLLPNTDGLLAYDFVV